MDAIVIAQHVAAAIAGGAGSALSVFNRLKNVERSVRKWERDREKTQPLLSFNLDEWKRNIIAGLRMDWDTMKADLEREVLELKRASNPGSLLMEQLLERLLDPVIRRVAALETSSLSHERRIRHFEEDFKASDFLSRDDYDRLTKGQADEWKEMTRLMHSVKVELEARRLFEERRRQSNS